MFKEKLLKHITKELGHDVELEVPPDKALGDYALACFPFAKELKKKPNEIAQDFAQQLTKTMPKYLAKVQTQGAYVNFFIDKQELATQLIKEITKKKEKFGRGTEGKGKTVVIEFISPNTNKALHLGHLRNAVLGDSTCWLYENQGYKVVRVQILNDRGIAICKNMLMYEKFYKGKTPKNLGRKGDHFIDDCYVRFGKEVKKNPKLNDEAQELLQKWEAGDKKTRALWKKLQDWYFEGENQTIERLELPPFDKNYHESDIYEKGKEIAREGLKKKIFHKDKDGAIIASFPKDTKLPDKVLLRPDGTSIYITQDLYLGEVRQKDYHFDEAIWVVGVEQSYHFDVLFEIYKLLGHKWAEHCYHLAYDHVILPEGKMSSREGTVIHADDLLLELEDVAKEAVVERHQDLDEERLHERAHSIGLAALKFMMLHTDAKRKIQFNPEDAVSFEGDTGPYLLYTYARANSILRKAQEENIVVKEGNYDQLNEHEETLISELNKYTEAAHDAYKNKSPHHLAHYMIKLARTFNEFYHHSSVLKAADEGVRNDRLQLVAATKQVLGNGLKLLGIRAIEEM